MNIIGLYQAKIRRIGPKNEFTGIYKYPIASAKVDKLGIQGDIQVDKRYHGGPERALHQYALSSYEKISKGYPLLHKKMWPGAIGENISVPTMNENTVCIGDIYQMGEVTVQVSGPRMPCFKISERFSTPNLHKFVAKHGIHGWYYRVLKDGKLSVDAPVTLIERLNPEISVSTFLQVVSGKITQPATIIKAIKAKGLDPEWHDRLQRQYPQT